jgi:hypothetical protein
LLEAAGMNRAVAILLFTAGCMSNDKKPCMYDNTLTPIAAPPALQYRDPQNGECQSFGSPNPTCDPACGVECPPIARGQLPDWGSCVGGCEGLSEAQCLASSNCHAAYQASTTSPTYWGCWELPPSGAVQGACTNLDAQTCSEHPDCTSLYTGPVTGGTSFETCNPKPNPTCAEAMNCGAGSECALDAGNGSGAPIQCQPIATAGTCGGLSCHVTAPTCPAMTVPGIGSSGCYTGFCLPTDECTQPLCATLNQAQCTARTDCNAIFDGSNCTCDSHGCTCATETFVRCQ